MAALHRWLGLIACVAVFSFALSGLMHPLMTRLQPQPIERSAPAVSVPHHALSPAAVLHRQGIAQITGLRLVRVEDQSAYRIDTQAGARYFAVQDGRELERGEARHAIALARHSTGDYSTAIQDIARITAFDADYPAVNQLLPVWRVTWQRDDGLTAYVDTRHDQLATLQDNPKRVVQAIFLQLHNFSALDDWPWLRLPLIVLLITATFATTLFGLALFFQRRRSRQRLGVRSSHRYLSLAIAITTLSFTVSGGWHLLHSATLPSPPVAPARQFAAHEIGGWLPHAAFELVRIGATPCYRMLDAASHAAPARHHGPAAAPTGPLASCHHTRDGEPLPDAERRLAEQLARYYRRDRDSDTGANSKPVLESIRPVVHFDDEYGFVNKRLPVWRLQFAGDEVAWYVEPSSGALALRADPAGRLAGALFSNLHKWQFLPSRDLRDALLSLVALAHLLVAGLGINLYCRRIRAYGRRNRKALPVTP